MTIDQLVGAVRTVYWHCLDVHHEDFDAGNGEVTEQIQDEAVADERKARETLIAWIKAHYPPTSQGPDDTDRPVALVMPDGCIVVSGVDSDGLAVVWPEDVHRLELPSRRTRRR